MNNKILFIMCSLGFIGGANGMKHHAESSNKNGFFYNNFKTTITQEDLIHRYSVDEKTKKLFDTNLPNERDINRTVREFEWLPEYVVKKGNGRVLGTLLIKQCAQDNQCDTIGALQKRYYQDPSGNLLTLVPKVKANEYKKFNLKQIQQIYKIAKKTGYEDIHRGNVKNTDEGITYFIDTEHKSFSLKQESEFRDSFADVIRTIAMLPLEEQAERWLGAKEVKYDLKARRKMMMS